MCQPQKKKTFTFQVQLKLNYYKGEIYLCIHLYNNNVVSQIQLTSNAVRIDSRLCVWRSGSVFVVGGKRVLMGKKVHGRRYVRV
jgi:hypothetical protein